MLNQPVAESFILEDTIDFHIEELVAKLSKEGFTIDKEDIKYNFFDRVEELYIASDILYGEDADLPGNFGVHRGYAGGGMHSGLQVTQFDRLPKNRQAKAERMLEYFKDTFWAVLKNADNITEETTGEELQDWDSVQI